MLFDATAQNGYFVRYEEVFMFIQFFTVACAVFPFFYLGLLLFSDSK